MRISWLAIFLAGCGASNGGGQGGAVQTPTAPPAAFEFVTPTQADLQQVRVVWSGRDLSSQDVEVALEDPEESAFDVTIYSHSVAGRTHYGIVAKPKAIAAPLPVVVFADGLNQSDPTIDGERVLGYFASILDRAVIVVPTFRGRTLLYKGRSFPAEGDFCDAYDGAADDTIALLNVVAESTPEANLARILVRGGSRGGNTALLLGVRDDRVRIVDATAAPVDFYRQEVRNRYGSQYTCQFFTDKTPEQSREKMLASSPLHFMMRSSVERVYLSHGTADAIVPLWNAEEMHAHLLAQDVDVEYRSYPGTAHIDIYNLAEYRQAQESAMEAFLNATT